MLKALIKFAKVVYVVLWFILKHNQIHHHNNVL